MAEQSSSRRRSKQIHKLFSVMGWIVQGHAVELIIANTAADAEYFAVHELGFVKVNGTSLACDRLHVGAADTKGISPAA
jgi:hypothetical protein